MPENFPVGSVEDFDLGYSAENYDVEAGTRNLLRWFSYVIDGTMYEVMAIDLSTGAYVAIQDYYRNNRVRKGDIVISSCGLR